MPTPPSLYKLELSSPEQLQPKSPKRSYKMPVLIGVGAICLISLTAGGVYLYRSAQPTHTVEVQPATTTAAPNESNDARPTTPQVAGVEVVSTTTTEEFGVVSANASEQCQPLFAIGELEPDPLSHPADELSWVGALDVVPTYTNPFQVTVDPDSSFPWRTDRSQPSTLQTSISFEYLGDEKTQAQLRLSWSPGTSGAAAKEVLLDGQYLTNTPKRTGQLYTGKSWQQLVFYLETIPLEIEPGEHTLTIAHREISPGDESVWDAVILLTECPPNS